MHSVNLPKGKKKSHVAAVGPVSADWDRNFKEAVAYREKYGFLPDKGELGNWVTQQLKSYASGGLDVVASKRIASLIRQTRLK